MLLPNFRYCTNDVKCTLFKSFCANMYCCPLWFNSTSSIIKKLKTSYNSALRDLFLIKKPYSASTMFVAHGILSFYELLRTSIYRFADRVSKNSNSIIMAMGMTQTIGGGGVGGGLNSPLNFDNGGDEHLLTPPD